MLAQIVGDIGKKKEPKLFEYFGGRPSELLLCHAHAPLSIAELQRGKDSQLKAAVAVVKAM